MIAGGRLCRVGAFWRLDGDRAGFVGGGETFLGAYLSKRLKIAKKCTRPLAFSRGKGYTTPSP